MWCIPPEADAAFVCQMEEVLDVYQRPHDPKRPLVCMDEGTKQLVQETRHPLATHPGQPAKIDFEYERHGTSNLFVAFAPLECWRHVQVTDRRTRRDWALYVRELVDVHFPDAELLVLVVDNLNIHHPASLYEAFPPAEAHRIAAKLEIHYTPKHGSWLNMAEIELSVLSRQCLDRRIPDRQTLIGEVTAWETRRNAEASTVDWRFTTEDARIKLKRLYPSF